MVAAGRSSDAVQPVARVAAAVAEVRYGDIDPPVVDQRDVTVRYQTSIHPADPTEQPLEASSLAWHRGNLLMPSDRHSHVIFSLPVALEEGRVALGLPGAVKIVESERQLLLDAECIAVGPAVDPASAATRPASAYVFCSMSNDPLGSRRPMRSHAARVALAPDGSPRGDQVSILSLEQVRSVLDEHLRALGVPEYESYNSDRGENTSRWGSVEGVSWTPDGKRMLAGMRNPLARERAILFALEQVDEAFDAEDGGLLRVADLFTLDLGGRGVSDLSWDPVTGGYLISAALSNGPRLSPAQPYPLPTVDSAIFWWSGDKGEGPILVARVADMNIDAVCRVGDSEIIALASDEGDVSEERRGHQSAVTLMRFAEKPTDAVPSATRAPAAKGGG